MPKKDKSIEYSRYNPGAGKKGNWDSIKVGPRKRTDSLTQPTELDKKYANKDFYNGN